MAEWRVARGLRSAAGRSGRSGLVLRQDLTPRFPKTISKLTSLACAIDDQLITQLQLKLYINR